MDDLLDNLPCGFLRLADDGTILRTNAALRSMCGYERDALQQQRVDVLLTPGARIFYQTHVFPLLRMRGRVDEVYLSLRAVEGADVPVLLNAVRREGEGEGGISDWAVVVMRRRNQFEEELIQAKKAAEAASRTKDRFLSMMSHDLRAPLSGISMAASVLSSGGAGPITESQRSELVRMRDASQYVLRLVKDLLNFARLEAGRAEVRLQPLLMADVLDHASGMVQHLVEEAGLTLNAASVSPDLWALADPDRLQQVVLNLLTNAVKFTDRGGRITLACEQQDARVLIHISDTGCGISTGRFDTIFEPFAQLDRPLSGEHSGVGLGLAISRELVRLMGGELTVASVLGEGSTFTVQLSAAEKSDKASGPTKEHRPPGWRPALHSGQVTSSSGTVS